MKTHIDIERYKDLIKMLMTVKNMSDDVYVCLYAYRTMAALFRTAGPDLCKQFRNEARQMLCQDLKLPIITEKNKYSAKESSLLYAGYLCIAFAE